MTEVLGKDRIVKDGKIMIVKTVQWEDSFKSNAIYYGKRAFKVCISLAVAGMLYYVNNGDQRFMMLVPVLELAQKYMKDKGLWF